MLSDATPPGPILAIAHRTQYSEENVLHLVNLYPLPPYLDERRVREHVKDVFRWPGVHSVFFGPPEVPDRDPRFRASVPFSFGWGKLTGYQKYPEGQEGEARLFPMRVFAEPRFEYATVTITDSGMDVRKPSHSSLYLRAGRQALAILDGFFAFGDEQERFVDDTLSDPRSRAWGATYYGPDLVRDIGWETLRTAPAWSVERDTRGGAWVLLAPLPFVPSEAKERRRRAVEIHLDLTRRFPN